MVALRIRTSMLSPATLDAQNARRATGLNLEATFTTIGPDTRRPEGARRKPHYCLDDPLSPTPSGSLYVLMSHVKRTGRGQSLVATVTVPLRTSSVTVPSRSVRNVGTWCSERAPRVFGVGWP